MTDVQHRAAAKEFAAHWKNRVDEKQETQRFWIDLLRNVYGVPNPEQYIEFEVPVKLSHTSFTDGYHYSKDVVYNNFLWPTPTDEQRARIGQTAQAILDAPGDNCIYYPPSVFGTFSSVPRCGRFRCSVPPRSRVGLHDGSVVLLVGFPQFRGHSSFIIQVGKAAIRVEVSSV